MESVILESIQKHFRKAQHYVFAYLRVCRLVQINFGEPCKEAFKSHCHMHVLAYKQKTSPASAA